MKFDGGGLFNVVPVFQGYVLIILPKIFLSLRMEVFLIDLNKKIVAFEILNRFSLK